MNITNLNRIFSTRGAEAALASATAAQMDDWIIDLLRAGKWNPSHKSAAKQIPQSAPREVRTPVDRNGDKRIVKVSLNSQVLGYAVENMGESGQVISTEGLGKLSLTEARTLIGKSISHPQPANAGKPTNDPAISQGMKGSSTGGGNKGGKKGK